MSYTFDPDAVESLITTEIFLLSPITVLLDIESYIPEDDNG
jgi:hypothetical protein